MAVDATNPEAVAKLYRLKGRHFRKPTHVIIPGEYYHTTEYGSKWLSRIVKVTPDAKKLIRKFWPGPLTIVLPLKAKGKSWKKLSAGTGTLGIRWPKNKIALELVKKFGKPITTTSANVSGQPNTYSVEQVKKQFQSSNPPAGGKPDFYLDGGKLRKTKPSTVVSMIKDAKILRVGPITEKQIANALNTQKISLLFP